MNQETVARDLLSRAGIEINGHNPWDIQVHDKAVYARVFASGSLGLGEAYMDGWFTCERLDEFFARVVGARLSEKLPLSMNLALLVARSKLQNRQTRRRARRVAEVHYDLPVEVFEATFDSRLTGSCGYWKEARTLDEAQDGKLDLICRKLGLRAGQHILDIGCGWGAFIGFAAERYGAQCIGVTVSEEQVAYARRRYAGLAAEFRLQDYRDVADAPFDHIASMGMFEHVGPKNYRAYFEGARRLVREDGLFLLHTIWSNEPSPLDPWIDRYIFPNGVLPTVGQIGTAVHGLFVVEDVHNFGADYDKTLMAWNAKFQSNRTDIAALMNKKGQDGGRFCRMWEYYLLGCAGSFRSREISVGQFVLSPRGVPGGYQSVR
ncbi:cyclopropane fatty acyl phospholipid synthase [Methylocapsa sp. S129]|uniref:cyclopropane fatty acyl phospholipid synthase n=1 Tax=Methylocapsa sp. S129 TaxID=1641869 RepID=UPI00131D36B6|nr:cyclopropane fatty acyl phospholipid synthase [Methylocapsa sp. S129]